MAYAKKAQYSQSSTRPSNGGQSRSTNSSNGEASPTTHYAKDSNKEFVNGLFIWENEGQYGNYLKFRVTEALQPGDYVVFARKSSAE